MRTLRNSIPSLPLENLAAVVGQLQAVLASIQHQLARSNTSPQLPEQMLSVACNEYLLAKARAQRSDGHLHHIHAALSAFATGIEAQQLATVTATQIESWLHSRNWSPRTRLGYLMDLRAFFNWCVRRGWLAANPALGVDKPTVDPVPAGIHSPGQVATVMEAAAGQSLALCRVMAVRYFAGLRTAEACRLTEANILRERGFIEVPALAAKTRARRLVPIEPNLAAWLDLGGELPLRQVNNRFTWLAQAAARQGVPWPANAPRHSFCSYHLARGESAAATALTAGHSEAMLFRHYREVVTRAEALEFFAIRPGRRN